MIRKFALAVLLSPTSAVAQSIPIIAQSGFDANGAPAIIRHDIENALRAKVDVVNGKMVTPVILKGSLSTTILTGLSTFTGKIVGGGVNNYFGPIDTSNLPVNWLAQYAYGDQASLIVLSPVGGGWRYRRHTKHRQWGFYKRSHRFSWIQLQF